MLVDLKAIRAGNPPIHARRNVDLDSLEKIEETGKTVEMPQVIIEEEEPEAIRPRQRRVYDDEEAVPVFKQPPVIAGLIVLVVSLLVNAVLLYVLLSSPV
jgi:hypothetical protein